MRIVIKTILLFFVVLLLVLGGWYWLERINIVNINIITDFIAKITQADTQIEEVDIINDALLIDKLRLEKKEAEIKKIQEELGKKNQELEIKSQDLAEKIAVMESARSDLEAQKNSLNEIIKNFENKSERIRQVASDLMNMPPQNAVDILVVFDDVLLIDTLIAVNEISEDQGLASVVPYWLSLMEPTRAGTVQRKLIELNR